MLRSVVLVPKATISGWASYVSPATSPYPWLGTGSTTPHEAWKTNGDGAIGAPSATKFVYCWPEGGTEHVVSFEPGPTLALFTKVTVKTRFDTSQTGPNNWWYPPDNGTGPGVQFVIRNRAKSGYISAGGKVLGVDYSPNAPGDLTTVNNFNSQPSDGDVWSLTPWWEYEWTSHPEGGPWTLEDINNLAAGVSFIYALGPNSLAYDNTAGSFFYIRVPQFVVTLTVQDLGGYVRSVRHNGSANLRMHRKARNTILMKVPAHEAKHEIGEVVNIAHTRGGDSEGEGWGVKPLERRSGWLVQRTYWPEALRVDDTAYDLKDFSCEAWGAFRIPIAWTPELSGLAYLDRGGEFTMTRAQDAWSFRPGDGAALRVLDDYPNLSEEGLAIHSGGDEELALYNYDAGGTGWASTDVTGGLTFAAETLSVMADELGYQTATRFTFGGTPGTGGKKRTVSLTAGDIVSIRARVRVISNDDPDLKMLEVALHDNSGNYWNETTRAWQASACYNEIANDDGFAELVMDQIEVQNTETHTVKIGRFSSAMNTASFVGAILDIQKGGDGCGTPLVTLANPITRVADVWEMDNSGAFTFWHRSRGMSIVEFRPFWRAALLSGDKVIARADHTGGAFDEVRFVPGSPDTIVFERSDGGGSKTVSVPVLDALGDPFGLTRANYIRVFVRWLDSSGWRDRPPFEAMVGYALYTLDGTFVSYNESTEVWDAPDSEDEDTFKFAGLDGWVRWFEVKRNPLSGAEAVWRR